MIRWLATALVAISLTTAPSCEPPQTTCPRWDQLIYQLSPSRPWDYPQVSRIMFKESGCMPRAQNTGEVGGTFSTGLLQVNDINLDLINQAWGYNWTLIEFRQAMKDPATNIAAAAVLCDFWRRARGDCLWPWNATRDQFAVA